jgi:hypothetical protein
MILFYKLSFITSFFSSATLSVIGKHFIWRNKFIELFALCQFAIIGNLAGHFFHPMIPLDLLPLIMSIVFFILGKTLFDIFKINSRERSTRMICVYLSLTSVQYLTISLFPNLDTHLSSGLFGSMVTATKVENISMIILYAGILLCLFFINKGLTKNTLEISLFQKMKKNTRDEYFLILPVVIGVFGLGLVHTLSFLALGAVILGSSFSSQKINNRVLIIINIIASIGGLLLSLFFEKLSTTPTQVLLLGAICLSVKVIQEKLLK